jgi:hypothetical protein
MVNEFKKNNEPRRLYFKKHLHYFNIFLNLNKDGEVKSRINSFISIPFEGILKRYGVCDHSKKNSPVWNMLITQTEYNKMKTTYLCDNSRNPFNVCDTWAFKGQGYVKNLKNNLWLYAPIIKGLSPPSNNWNEQGYYSKVLIDDNTIPNDKNKQFVNLSDDKTYEYWVNFEGKTFIRSGNRCYNIKKEEIDRDSDFLPDWRHQPPTPKRGFCWNTFRDDGGLIPIELVKKNDTYYFRVPTMFILTTRIGKYKRWQKLNPTLLITDNGKKLIINCIGRWELFKPDDEGAKENKILNCLNMYKRQNKPFCLMV